MLSWYVVPLLCANMSKSSSGGGGFTEVGTLLIWPNELLTLPPVIAVKQSTHIIIHVFLILCPFLSNYHHFLKVNQLYHSSNWQHLFLSLSQHFNAHSMRQSTICMSNNHENDKCNPKMTNFFIEIVIIHASRLLIEQGWLKLVQCWSENDPMLFWFLLNHHSSFSLAQTLYECQK